MPASPAEGSEQVVSVRIKADGTEVTAPIISVKVSHALNRVPVATIVLVDGDMPAGEFPLADAATFKPGAAVQVEAGYGNQYETIYKGIVVKVGISIDGDNNSRLVVECKDKAVKMTIGRKCANYVDSKDSDIITTLIGNYGLTADVEATTEQHKELVQYHCTDWDYMLLRAEANGKLVNVEDAKVSVKAPDTSSAAVLSVTYGQDLMEFHAEVDAQTQLSSVETLGWDMATHAVVKQTATPATLNAQGDLTSATLAAVAAPSAYRLQSQTPLENGVLQSWGKAQQMRSGLSRIRGSMRFQGSALAKPNKLIDLAGVGSRFNGKVYVTAVQHEIEDGDWTTEAEFGLSPKTLAEAGDVAAPPAAGLAGAVSGLHIGIVMKLDADPAGQHKVQVKVPLMEATTEGVWARLANFYSSNTFGTFFIPEIGDEVVLGFLDQDPSHPIILGSLYSRRPPAYTLTAENYKKAFVTRSKLKIEFDDEKKIITLWTPANNTIVLNDDEKSILLKDQNNNKILLDPAGITIETPKDIKIDAKGKIDVTAVGNIATKSQADVTEQGLNVKHQANVAFSAKGGASAELTASGQTTVKGAMVMIN